MTKKNIGKYLLCFFELAFFLFIFLNLFNRTRLQSLDLDEIVWVHDTNVYNQRINNNWSYFKWEDLNVRIPWSSHDFRLFDQPHLVKYIYGSIFKLNKIDIWSDKSQELRNYSYFVEGGKKDSKVGLNFEINSQELTSQLSEEVVSAIKIARLTSAVFALLFLITLFYFIKKEANFFTALISLVFIYFNEIFIWNSPLANADNISNFFILLASICFYYLFWKGDLIKGKLRFFLYFSSAIFTSFAMGSKINGLILLYLFVIFKIIDLIFTKKTKILKSLYELIFWLLLVLVNYLYLQPELGSQYLVGFYKFISQRVEQQTRFYNVSGSLDLFSYISLVIKRYLGDNLNIFFLFKLVTIIIGLPYFFKKILINARSSRNKILNFFTFLLTFILIFSYARVGFERYLVIPIILLILTSVRGFTLIISEKLFK
ncbi:MAG: phospholipid carrier-dependent glycosyltransferase [Candidatus Pacebacteria bacterium]|nr:phospholipid carrier-dependent glycosyltransferase [Candidatus Paceibacterota bacterium]